MTGTVYLLVSKIRASAFESRRAHQDAGVKGIGLPSDLKTRSLVGSKPTAGTRYRGVADGDAAVSKTASQDYASSNLAAPAKIILDLSPR